MKPLLWSSLVVLLGSVQLTNTAEAQTPLYTFHGDSDFDRLGTSVSAAGDVNRDGFADVIVGIPGASGFFMGTPYG